MIEFVLCLPVMLLLFAMVVEAARSMALLVVLDVATQAAAEDLALRHIAVDRAGLSREGAANEPDIGEALHAPLREAVLAYVASFPGYHPFGSGDSAPRRPRGELYVDLANGHIEVRSHICVPLFFVFRQGNDGNDDAIAPSGKTRDCQGRFLSLPDGPTVRLESTSVVPLPAAYQIYARGLAAPADMPFVNVPGSSLPLIGTRAWGPKWQSLFSDAASLFEETRGQGIPEAPDAKER